MRELEVESGGPIWDLVAEFLERKERGDQLDIDSFVQGHPDVADRLREALAGFEWMEEKASPAHAAMDEVLPRAFGNYQLLRVIGRGGMGCVYEAFHRPLKRHVAVKALPSHLSNVREFRLRFLREAQVIASLHHTHIAPVFEVGQIGSTLYLAMPFIDGPNLRELILPQPDEQPVVPNSLRRRLPKPNTAAYCRWIASIGVQAADAIAHAHEHGVIHRDIKPSNLLIDERGQIWIVDFGLAKAATHPTVTQPGELIGTLRYASPEQIRGESLDARSDIYSLGVTLYELLLRRPAFPDGPTSQVALAEAVRPCRIDPRIPRDLETVVMRAIAKRPEDRYASADALADDLRRVIRDEPIRARPIGWIGRAVRWGRRNSAVMGVAAAALVLLLAFAAFLWFRESKHQVARRIDEAISSERYLGYLMASAANMIDSGQPGRTALALDMIREAAQRQFRAEMWEFAVRAVDQLDVQQPIPLADTDRPIVQIAVSPDGQSIAGAEPSGRLCFWSASDGQLWSSNGFNEPLTSLIWSPTGSHIVATSDKHVWIGRVDPQSQQLDDVRVIVYEAARVAFDPTGRHIAVWANTIGLWSIADGQFIWQRPGPHHDLSRPGPPYRFLAWSPDGGRVAAVPVDEATVEFWSMPEGERQLPIGVVVDEISHRAGAGTLSALAFTPDSAHIACGCADGSIRVYDCRSGEWKQNLHGHEMPVRWLQFVSPAGDPTAPPSHTATHWLVSADDHDVRLWDPVRDAPAVTLVKDLNGFQAAAIDRRGTAIAIVDGSAAVRAWRMPELSRHRVIGPEPSRVTAIAASPSGGRFAWSDESGRVVIAEADGSRPRVQLEPGLKNVQLAFGPGGKVLAMAGEGDPPVQLYTPETLQMRPLAAGRPAARTVAFVNAGQRIAVAHDDGRLIVWNIESASPFATVESAGLRTVVANRDGKWLAGGSAQGDVRIWNTATMSSTYVADAHASEVLALAFTPDGRSLASASRDGLICRWAVPSLARELHFEGPGGAVRSLHYCLDGSTLASCGGDGRLFLWASDPPVRVGALRGRAAGRFDTVTVLADGQTIVAGGGPRQSNLPTPGMLEIWDLEAIRQAIVAAGLPDWRTAR